MEGVEVRACAAMLAVMAIGCGGGGEGTKIMREGAVCPPDDGAGPPAPTGPPCDGLMGDYDGDGLADCALPAASTNGALTIVVHRGVSPTAYATAGIETTAIAHGKLIAAFDLDHDGRTDLIASEASDSKPVTSTTYLLRGQPDGTFTSASVATTGALGSPDPGLAHDFDGDCRTDLLFVSADVPAPVGIAEHPRWLVLSAPNPTTFTAATTDPLVPVDMAYVDVVLVVDLNGDRFLDVMASVSRPYPAPEYLAAALNAGDGTFTLTAIPATEGFKIGSFMDVDGDGDIDALVLQGQETVIIRNDGRGHFTAAP